MAYLIWSVGLMRRRWLTLAGTAAGIAVSVAMIATLAGFVADTSASMTRRAIADVPVDWQVQLAPNADAKQAAQQLQDQPGAMQLMIVGYFDAPRFASTGGGTVQTTGTGKVLGLPVGYTSTFPGQVRPLVGQGRVLLAQQTAANLHAAPGSTVTVERPGMSPVDVTVDGIVDLPNADALFSVPGAASPISAPQAPPDNVLILPLATWHSVFDPVSAVAPGSVHLQLHATIPHQLPSDPSAAFDQVQAEAKNYEARLAGAGVVSDNLSARLDAARADARYAQALFVLMGVPGIALAALLTVVLVSSGAVRRRREEALLRLRGASLTAVTRFVALESLIVAIAGTATGIGIALAVVRIAYGRWTFGATAALAVQWLAVAATAGISLAVLAVLVPIVIDVRRTTVTGARASVRRSGSMLWERLGIDVLLLALCGVAFWLTARSGYQVVVGPEGGSRLSLSYTAFAPPFLLWAGASLLVIRVSGAAMTRGRRLVQGALRPVAGPLSSLVSSSISRQRVLLGVGVLTVTLGVGFALSTAVFNSTYAAQSRVDAELTNGADVTVKTSGGDLSPAVGAIATQQGVQAAEPMQHRFAYVGNDLQDIYGIHPDTIRRATRLSDAFFASSSADGALQDLKTTPDGVLVAAETARDFKLEPGDTIRLRLQSASDGQYHAVPFRFIGVVREFPTAPKDSFLVANADYIAQQTGSSATETVLIKTSGSPSDVAARVRVVAQATGASVQDIGQQVSITNSSLTAISVRGLTRIEMGFAAALGAAGSGLVLALGLEERRRTLAIAAALGARSRQLGAFVWSEAALMLAGGLACGITLGWGVSWVLVKLLTGVFDPPPTQLSIPWAYVAAMTAGVAVPIVVAAAVMTRLASRSMLETMRRL